jgi:hypothetical protein
MRRNSLAIAAGLAMASLAGHASPQVVDEGGYGNGVVVTDSVGCTHTFGSGDFVWCLSSTGNLQRLTAPAGVEFIDHFIKTEGYAICVNDVPLYYDRGEVPPGFTAALGFGKPVVIAGPSGSGITISRDTLDGLFRLDQKWSADKNERDLTVQMTLSNLGTRAVGSIRLLRIVDVDANGFGNNWYDRSDLSVWFRGPDSGFAGALAVTALTRTPRWRIAVTNTQAAYDLVLPCAPDSRNAPGASSTDVAAFIGFDVGSLGAGRRVAVKVGYQVL